jgi:hypothetical protein
MQDSSATYSQNQSAAAPEAGFISAIEAAQRYKLSNDHIASLCRKGKVEGVLIGRTRYVREESLSRYLAQVALERQKRHRALSEQIRQERSTYSQAQSQPSHYHSFLTPLLGSTFIFMLIAFGFFAAASLSSASRYAPVAYQTPALSQPNFDNLLNNGRSLAAALAYSPVTALPLQTKVASSVPVVSLTEQYHPAGQGADSADTSLASVSVAAAGAFWGGYVTAIDIAGQLQANVYESALRSVVAVADSHAISAPGSYLAPTLAPPSFTNLINNGENLSAALTALSAH